MNNSDTYMVILAKIKDFQLSNLTASLLLCLVSLSFIVEHMPYVESDILELVENTKQEKDAKDLELLVCGEGIFITYEDDNIVNGIYAISNILLKGISIDILTPPPEFGYLIS